MAAYTLTDGKWKKYCKTEETLETINGTEPLMEWISCSITEVPLDVLLNEWDNLIIELSEKETELIELKELYTGEEFDIVYKSDINFKALYGSSAEKVRQQHASDVLSELNDKINSLKLSIQWIKNYIQLIRETVRVYHGVTG